MAKNMAMSTNLIKKGEFEFGFCVVFRQCLKGKNANFDCQRVVVW